MGLRPKWRDFLRSEETQSWDGESITRPLILHLVVFWCLLLFACWHWLLWCRSALFIRRCVLMPRAAWYLGLSLWWKNTDAARSMTTVSCLAACYRDTVKLPHGKSFSLPLPDFVTGAFLILWYYLCSHFCKRCPSSPLHRFPMIRSVTLQLLLLPYTLWYLWTDVKCSYTHLLTGTSDLHASPQHVRKNLMTVYIPLGFVAAIEIYHKFCFFLWAGVWCK